MMALNATLQREGNLAWKDYYEECGMNKAGESFSPEIEDGL